MLRVTREYCGHDTTIAAIFPDGPQRYFDTVYNDDYCRHHDLLGAGRTVTFDPVQFTLGDRLLGKEKPMRFIDVQKKGFFERLFGGN